MSKGFYMGNKVAKNGLPSSHQAEHEQNPLSPPIATKVHHLESELSQLKNLIDVLPGDIYWKDKEGVWMGVNQSGLKTLKSMGFAKSEKDIIGKTDYELFGKETAETYRMNDIEVMEKQIEMTREEAIELPNGQTMIQLSSKRPLFDNEGKMIGIVGNTLNITHLKKIEQDLLHAKESAEAADAAKTEFLENMRHDIRTPLSGIVGLSEILKSEFSNEYRIQEYADNLIASSHALLDLMNEVLEAVRVSSGEIPKLKRKFNLVTMLNKVIDLHRAKAEEKKLRLNIIFDKNLPKFVIGDKIRLHRIVLELVGNALNFTTDGHVTLTADLAKNDNNNIVVRIKVSDSGIGIERDKQQEIYLQFKRLVPSYKGLYKGAGLGLFVVKKFIDELAGEIYVNSSVGEGTSFTCLIPLQEPLLNDDSGIDDEELSLEDETYLTPYSHKSVVSPKENKINKVLVVEDNITAQKVVQTILTAMKCDVHLASSGQEALNQINSNHYDLIFMDIGLGEGADGYEVTEQIRKKEKPSDHVPIVALTAHAADESKQRCIEAGMDAVLAKPITQAHASNIINAFLRPKENPELEKAKKAQSDLPDKEEDLFELSQFPLLETEETLKNLGDANILSELLQNMIEKDLPDDFNNMKQAFSDQNYEQVEKLAHKIKGGALYVGTIRMRYACQYLERYQKTGKTELFEKLFHQAVSTIEETISYIKLWLLANK